MAMMNLALAMNKLCSEYPPIVTQSLRWSQLAQPKPQAQPQFDFCRSTLRLSTSV